MQTCILVLYHHDEIYDMERKNLSKQNTTQAIALCLSFNHIILIIGFLISIFLYNIYKIILFTDEDFYS